MDHQQYGWHANKKEAEDCFMDQALDALESGNIEDEALYMESSDHVFIPSATAKHRVPKTFSTKNPLQKYGGMRMCHI